MRKKDKLKFKYEFDAEFEILFKNYHGNISIEDIIDSWDYALAYNIIPKNNKGFILDYRDASFSFDTSDYEKIPQYYRQHPDIFRNHKIAIVTENPKDIVIPILVRRQDDGYESKPFSTLGAAIEWILT